MHLVFSKRFGLNPNVTIFDAESLGVVVDGNILADKEMIRRNLAGLSKELVLFPVNCNGNHWCSVMINLEKGSVAIYDSSSSSYLTSVRSVAQTLIMLLPELARPRPRVQTYESGLGVQLDSYNCGVYVLLAFEMFCGGDPLGHLHKKNFAVFEIPILAHVYASLSKKNRLSFEV
ncbi:hypothetical protein L914_05089 [Phytophthora nicotianae]|uniref:Ubiquitin-like protease family profile domain-containing protein n=1 Tax=Phytophthora nicotianae TaxID=4792 RepID=W2NSQ0_PHYNI|nr:hypothetical protein L914_05089 [Phytophthora nicotianae]